MKRLTYTKPHALAQLHGEVLAALPALREVMIVEAQGDNVWITVPDDVDETAISAIVTAHVPNPTYGVDTQFNDARNFIRQYVGLTIPGTELQQLNYDKAVAVVLRRIIQELR